MENPSLLTPGINEDTQKLEFKLEIEAYSSENNLYSIIFSIKEYSYLNIQAINKMNNIKTFSNNFSIKQIKEDNKYFNKFNNLKEICKELKQSIQSGTIKLNEKDKLLIILVILENNEIANFELIEDELNEKEQIKDINKTLLQLKNEINDLKKENIELRKITNNQNNEINELKKEIIELKALISKNNLKKENIELNKIIPENKNIINENIINKPKEQIKKVNNTCCLFNNNLSYATEIYNISKFPIPFNCEIILHFKKVSMVRVGITFDK